MKLLAIDYGEKRMGFALGDKLTKTAVPLDQMNRKSPADDIRTIGQIVNEFEVNTIIIGYPLNMDGTKNDITKKVENFAQSLKKKLKIEIKLVDERLSSFEAEEMLKTVKKKYQDRKKIYSISSKNLQLIEEARSVGASAKFTGSGGAIVGTYKDEKMFSTLKKRLRKLKVKTIKPQIATAQGRA